MASRMDRRAFLRRLAAATAVTAATSRTAASALQPRPGLPRVKVVSRYAPAASPGMPGPYPGRVVSVTSAGSVDTSTGAANAEVVRDMMARGMRALTGADSTTGAWRRFFEPADRVGIKVNCGGDPPSVSPSRVVARGGPAPLGLRRPPPPAPLVH